MLRADQRWLIDLAMRSFDLSWMFHRQDPGKNSNS
jgi:hypothetical protein